mgnify:CR=1 FL=1
MREAPLCKQLIPKLVPIRPNNLPQHVGAMSWHHAKFHDFLACFGFTWIKKPSFSIFPAEPRRIDVWISFPFLAWDLEIHPRTHMWFFNQLWCTRACACISNLSYAHKGHVPSEPRAFLREAPVCKKVIPKLVPIRPGFLPQHVSAMTWHHAKFHDFQASFGFTGI